MRALAEGCGAAGGDVVPDDLAPEEHDDALVTRWRVQREPRAGPHHDAIELQPPTGIDRMLTGLVAPASVQRGHRR